MRRRLKRKYNKEQIHALYENAGLYYQLNKEPIRALEMYQKAGEKERIASLLIENARTAPNNGYYYQLKILPEAFRRKNPYQSGAYDGNEHASVTFIGYRRE